MGGKTATAHAVPWIPYVRSKARDIARTMHDWFGTGSINRHGFCRSRLSTRERQAVNATCKSDGVTIQFHRRAISERDWDGVIGRVVGRSDGLLENRFGPGRWVCVDVHGGGGVVSCSTDGLLLTEGAGLTRSVRVMGVQLARSVGARSTNELGAGPNDSSTLVAQSNRVD
jgi:hypothetical protein